MYFGDMHNIFSPQIVPGNAILHLHKTNIFFKNLIDWLLKIKIFFEELKILSLKQPYILIAVAPYDGNVFYVGYSAAFYYWKILLELSFIYFQLWVIMSHSSIIYSDLTNIIEGKEGSWWERTRKDNEAWGYQADR